MKISERAVGQGFEWRNEGEVWEKLESEIAELKEAIANPDRQHPEKAVKARKEMELKLGECAFYVGEYWQMALYKRRGIPTRRNRKVQIALSHDGNSVANTIKAADFRRTGIKLEKASSLGERCASS